MTIHVTIYVTKLVTVTSVSVSPVVYPLVLAIFFNAAGQSHVFVREPLRRCVTKRHLAVDARMTAGTPGGSEGLHRNVLACNRYYLQHHLVASEVLWSQLLEKKVLPKAAINDIKVCGKLLSFYIT